MPLRELGRGRRAAPPGNLRPETFYGPSAGLTEVLDPGDRVRTTAVESNHRDGSGEVEDAGFHAKADSTADSHPPQRRPCDSPVGISCASCSGFAASCWQSGCAADARPGPRCSARWRLALVDLPSLSERHPVLSSHALLNRQTVEQYETRGNPDHPGDASRRGQVRLLGRKTGGCRLSRLENRPRCCSMPNSRTPLWRWPFKSCRNPGSRKKSPAWSPFRQDQA